MPKFIVDLWLDGYETEEEMIQACEEFIYEQLSFSASSVSVERIEDEDQNYNERPRWCVRQCQ